MNILKRSGPRQYAQVADDSSRPGPLSIRPPLPIYQQVGLGTSPKSTPGSRWAAFSVASWRSLFRHEQTFHGAASHEP